jgi:hypothetical protein
MSVLACTIGTLIVLLATMSLSAVGASVASEDAFAESQAAREVERLVLEADREDIEAAEELWRSVDEALDARGLQTGLSAPEIVYEIERKKAEVSSARTLSKLEARLDRLELERGEVETSIAVLESRRETLPILIDPTGLSRSWKPFFIECDEGGATAYRASDDFKYFVPRDELSTSGDFGRYLRRVRAVPGALLVLLVRPDGLLTARRTEGIARTGGVRVARLPLPGEGAIDWNLIRRAEGSG